MPSTPNELKASKAYHKAVKELEAFKKITAQRNKEYYENNKEILAQKRREKYQSKKQLKNQVINVVKIDTENEEIIRTDQNKQDIITNIQVNNNVEPEPEITNMQVNNNVEPEPEITNNEPEIIKVETEINTNIQVNNNVEPEITKNIQVNNIVEPEIKNENLVLSVNIPVKDYKTQCKEFKQEINNQITPEIIKIEPEIIKVDKQEIIIKPDIIKIEPEIIKVEPELINVEPEIEEEEEKETLEDLINHRKIKKRVEIANNVIQDFIKTKSNYVNNEEFEKELLKIKENIQKNILIEELNNDLETKNELKMHNLREQEQYFKPFGYDNPIKPIHKIHPKTPTNNTTNINNNLCRTKRNIKNVVISLKPRTLKKIQPIFY